MTSPEPLRPLPDWPAAVPAVVVRVCPVENKYSGHCHRQMHCHPAEHFQMQRWNWCALAGLKHRRVPVGYNRREPFGWRNEVVLISWWLITIFDTNNYSLSVISHQVKMRKLIITINALSCLSY